MSGVPLTLTDSQLLLPQSEWDAIAREARLGPSFALQLQGTLLLLGAATGVLTGVGGT